LGGEGERRGRDGRSGGEENRKEGKEGEVCSTGSSFYWS